MVDQTHPDGLHAGDSGNNILGSTDAAGDTAHDTSMPVNTVGLEITPNGPTEPPTPDDLMHSIPGMYRILDPVVEQSSSGLG